MLMNAHIWAIDAALMRAFAVQQHSENDENPVLGRHSEDKFTFRIEPSADERRILGVTHWWRAMAEIRANVETDRAGRG